jgi:hypothetical protein
MLAGAAPAPRPLRERIDRHIAAARKDFAKFNAGPTSDAEFLRRIYLDLVGSIPTSLEARAFLNDKTANKRARLIDRLLASPEHARRMALHFEVFLMERRPAMHVPQAAWHEYLRGSFAANKPWDVLAKEILSSDGSDPKTRPAARFILDRAAEPNLVTRDISRLFMGTNLQCAQCHDHPKVEEYKQAHYYGLMAFFNRTSIVRDQRLKAMVLSEKADGEVRFQSVFDPAKKTHATAPRLPGLSAISDPADPKSKGYLIAPGRAIRAVPRYSRRALLGPSLARADFEPFRRNIANRLWAMMMGRGLVDPLDMDHPANPPSHPELLDEMAKEIAARKFDMKWLIKEIALSQTYQQSSALPDGLKEKDAPLYAAAKLKPLSPEQLGWALLQATGLTDANRMALGKGATEAAVFARLSGSANQVVAAFGARAGEPDRFDAWVDQALFLANGSVIRGWLVPQQHTLTYRLASLKTSAEIAEELYLSALTRFPDEEEKREVADMLARRAADRPAALRDLVWALLASAEFRFNH